MTSSPLPLAHAFLHTVPHPAVAVRRQASSLILSPAAGLSSFLEPYERFHFSKTLARVGLCAVRDLSTILSCCASGGLAEGVPRLIFYFQKTGGYLATEIQPAPFIIRFHNPDITCRYRPTNQKAGQ